MRENKTCQLATSRHSVCSRTTRIQLCDRSGLTQLDHSDLTQFDHSGLTQLDTPPPPSSVPSLKHSHL
eukprot:355798-Chlamydomonas_euryale.AAC.3